MSDDDPASLPDGAPPCVLIADDDPRVLRALRALIEDELEVQVTEARTREEVLAGDRQARPAAIVLDLLLPRQVDGLQALRVLAQRRDRPVIAISARGGLREAALEAGAFAFLEKGGAPEQLVEILRSAGLH